MMWKNIYAKTLLAFFVCLTPVSLIGCNRALINNDRSTYNSTQQVDNQNTINTEINELDKSIDAFIREIQAHKDEDKQSFKSDNLQNANQKIQNISIAIQNIRQAPSVKLPENSGELLNNIQERIKNIKKVIEPLINGLSRESVGQVQENLGIFKVANRNNKDYGKLGNQNKGKISNYLSENKNNLIRDIDRLFGNDINSQVKSLNQQVKELKEQSKNNNTLNFIAWTSLILSFLSLLLFATLLLEREGFSALSNKFKDKKDEKKPDEISTLSPDTLSINRPETSNDVENKKNNSEQYSGTDILSDKPSNDTNQSPENKTVYPSQEQHQKQQDVSNQFSQDYTGQPSNLQTSIPDLLAAYNNNPGSLSLKAIVVNLTEESIDVHRLGSRQKAIFEAKKAGSYWILQEGRTDYLVPKKHFTFNEYQYKTAQALFQCQGYQPSSRQKFHVIKPARVTPISQEKWQLEEMGILKFY